MSQSIHLSNYSDNRSIQIACDQTWTEPACGKGEATSTGIGSVYKSDDARLYTFDSALVTCRRCIEWIERFACLEIVRDARDTYRPATLSGGEAYAAQHVVGALECVEKLIAARGKVEGS